MNYVSLVAGRRKVEWEVEWEERKKYDDESWNFIVLNKNIYKVE